MSQEEKLSVSLVHNPSEEQKITLLGAAAVAARMAQECHEEGTPEQAATFAVAARMLEDMVRGELPLVEFADPNLALKLFTEMHTKKEAEAEETETATVH